MRPLYSNPSQLFFAPEGKPIARYDKPRYPIFDKLNKLMRSFNWEPETVTMSGERRSYNSMTDAEQFIFTSGLQRAIMLDTKQGEEPTLVFGPSCTDPSLSNCITTWQQFETIHSESYTHILQAVYPDGGTAVVDAIPGITAITDCAAAISDAYDRMKTNPTKENLYLALCEANALEALRFFNFFATVFNFKKRLLCSGSGDVVKLIARDENIHLSLVMHILKALPKDDPEFVQIIGDNRERALQIYRTAADQEKQWAQYLFSHGPILGLNEGILCDHIDYREIKATNGIGLTSRKLPPLNISYMEEFVDGSDKVQAAPQEDGALEYLSAASLFNDMESFKPKLSGRKLSLEELVAV